MIDSQLLLQFLITLPALLVSMVFHEVSHGYVAFRLGDETAFKRGRLSANPLRHLDPLGTIMLFLTYFVSGGTMLFGWAKPVPINPSYFKNPQRGMMWVGAAGPVANFMLASATALVMKWLFPVPVDSTFLGVLFLVFQLNLILMAFNLIPVPPLDGSRILGGFLGREAYIRWISLDRFGMLFIMLLFFVMIQFNLISALTGLYHLFLPASYGF